MPYLKQQRQYDIRSFDIITNAEKEHFPKLIPDLEKASPAKSKSYFDTIKQIIATARSPKRTANQRTPRRVLQNGSRTARACE